jgi:addiction module RelE/StbE family toxin
VSYQVEYSEEAYRDLRDVPSHLRNRIKALIAALENEPRPARSKELRDLPGRYRIPLEGWRIIYRIDDEEQVILITRVKRKTGPETYEDIE